MNPNYNDAQCAATPRQMMVSDQLDRLMRALEELHVVTEGLANRLQPVMLPIHKGNDVLSKEAVTEQSPLAQELNARVSSIYSVRDKLCQIQNYLDL